MSVRIRTGYYKGKSVEEVPAGWLLSKYKSKKLDIEVRRYVEVHMEALQTKKATEVQPPLTPEDYFPYGQYRRLKLWLVPDRYLRGLYLSGKCYGRLRTYIETYKPELCDASALTPTDKMPFGKYERYSMSRIPDDYLSYMYHVRKVKGALKDYIEQYRPELIRKK